MSTDFSANKAMGLMQEALKEAFCAGEAAGVACYQQQKELLADYAKELGFPELTVGDLINSHRRLRTEAVMEKEESAGSAKTVWRDGDDLL